jgi:hypothetical protein
LELVEIDVGRTRDLLLEIVELLAAGEAEGADVISIAARRR